METAPHELDYQGRPRTVRLTATASEREEAVLREELLSVLLHDLRSPLGAIRVLSDLICAMNDKDQKPDPRQLQLLQEAVTKAQCVLDDAVDLQSVIRGSSTFTRSVVDLHALVQSCLEKARDASYFGKLEILSQLEPGKQLVRVDLEKLESVILCIFQEIAASGSFPKLKISTVTEGDTLTLHMDGTTGDNEPLPTGEVARRGSLRGRLGTRHAGESRYNFLLCRRVLTQMGVHIDAWPNGSTHIAMQFPLLNDRTS